MVFIVKDSTSRLKTRGRDPGYIRETSARLRVVDGHLAIEDNGGEVDCTTLGTNTSVKATVRQDTGLAVDFFKEAGPVYKRIHIRRER